MHPIPRHILLIAATARARQAVGAALRDALHHEGLTVVVVGDGSWAVEIARRAPPALVVAERCLPGLDGLHVCRALRAAPDRRLRVVPILLLGPAGEDGAAPGAGGGDAEDVVVGLDSGADDYLAAPVSRRELVARVRALLRRARAVDRAAGGDEAEVRPIACGEVEVDTVGRRTTRAGREVPLTAREFDLLAFLLSHPGRVFTREQLLDRVWAPGFGGQTRTVDVHVRWLRRKLEHDPGRPQLLETVRGVGYRSRRNDLPAA